MPRRHFMPSLALALAALACLSSTASARQLVQARCSATGLSTNGTAYNFICSGSTQFGSASGPICLAPGVETCYAASDMTCSGTPMLCPGVTLCSVTGIAYPSAGSWPVGGYNTACKGIMDFAGPVLKCHGLVTCYPGADMTCSGAPIECVANGCTIAGCPIHQIKVVVNQYKAYLKFKYIVIQLKDNGDLGDYVTKAKEYVTKTWGWGHAGWSSESTMAKLTVEVNNADDVFAAHVHNCSADCNGPVVATIFSFADAAGAPVYVSGSFSVSTMVDLAMNPMLGELIMSGNAYVNVLSKVNPSGELRGQLVRQM
jgi:hypothetical protein